MGTIKRDENGRKVMRVQRGTARSVHRFLTGKRSQPIDVVTQLRSQGMFNNLPASVRNF